MKHIRFEKILSIKKMHILFSFSTALWSEDSKSNITLIQSKSTKSEGVKFYRFVLAPLLILVCFERSAA